MHRPQGEDREFLRPQPLAWPALRTHIGISLVRRLGLLWLRLPVLELCFLELLRVDFCTEDAKKPSPHQWNFVSLQLLEKRLWFQKVGCGGGSSQIKF